MSCDGLMLVGGSNYGLILVSKFWVLVMVGGGSGLVGWFWVLVMVDSGGDSGLVMAMVL